jgi:hypothetical protein
MTNRRQRVKRLEISLVAALLWSVQACGGRSVELNQSSSSGSAMGTPTIAANEAAPIILPEEIVALWVDESRFYWVTSGAAGKLQGCLKDDCDHSVITYAASDIGWAVVAAGHVSWLGGRGAIYSCPSAGCNGAPTLVVQDPAAMYNVLSSDGDYVYWPSSLDIYRCPVAGCGSTPELVAANHLPSTPLSFQAKVAYWGNDYLDSGDPPTILRAPSDGSAPPSNFIQASAQELATDNSNIYWVDAGDSNQPFPPRTVSSCPLAGCGDSNPTQLATTEQDESSFQIEGKSLFWLETQEMSVSGISAIRACSVTGCSAGAEVVVSGIILSFAVDDDFVYWVSTSAAQKQAGDGGSKSIHRAPR